MAQLDERGATPAMASTPALDAADKSRRFTPLRSYVTRARALGEDARRDPMRSPLIPLVRSQGYDPKS